MEDNWRGIPRNKIDWFPTINYASCNNECNVCLDFCPNGVYIRDGDSRIIVKNPYNCMVGCNGCETICPGKAISFPFLDILTEVKKKWGVE